MASRKDEKAERKEYSPPKVVHTEVIQTHAVVCNMSDDSCAPGPIQS